MHALETYLKELCSIRSTGAALPETSYYPPLANLLNEIGKALKPKVCCVIHLKDQGAGIPDGGLFTPDQFQRGNEGKPQPGQLPSRGAIEVKPVKDDAWVTADGEQVSRYWGKYRQVLVTNYRDFVLVGEGPDGKAARLENYRLAENEKSFWESAANPRSMATRHTIPFQEFLIRVMRHAAPLSDPEDVAWFLASYARAAKAQIEHSKLPALVSVRSALEEALGLKFEGEKGDHFFRSTFVQTLFYGVFSAWVLWSKERAPKSKKLFNWREAAWTLRVPMIKALFEQLATPSKLGALELVEIMNWTAAALNRVQPAFFEKFEEEHAVQYFYEPFLEAFDPELRKDLGVWYTPPEIVRYMVARVDTVLREELNLPDGLADKRVFVLDPCCGTGAFLVEVIRRIAETLKTKGEDALGGQDLKQAAMKRVFGFEILPAPFVVAHLQLGLMLRSLGAPLSDTKNERVGVYLTNALTGWQPPKEPKIRLLFPELEEERDAAENVKQHVPILVVLGNPPYNGFAGLAVDEERDLSTAYRTTKMAAAPQGQGLNDLYVRFYRMAERRIVEMNKPAKGVVCFISNYSWLDGLSFTGMREKFLNAFNRIWIDNLHGDRIISEYAPNGKTSETIFAMQGQSPGIKVGTAITLLASNGATKGKEAQILFRDHFESRAEARRKALLESLEEDDFDKKYENILPVLEIGLPFKPRKLSTDYLKWPLLPKLFPKNFPGATTARDYFLVDIDKGRLSERVQDYFNVKLPSEDLGKKYPPLMENTARYKAKEIRDYLLKRGKIEGRVIRYCVRPFDIRWLYWEPETKLLDEKRTEYLPHVFAGNFWIEARQHQAQESFSRGSLIREFASDFGNGRSSFFPLWLSGSHIEAEDLFSGPIRKDKVPNLSDEVSEYLKRIKVKAVEDVFFHTLSILHTQKYREENAGGLRQDWPRVPLPATAKILCESADLGRKIAALLDLDSPVAGVSSGVIRSEIKVVGPISREGGGTLNPDAGDLAVTAGWGHAGQGGVTMPGKGKYTERAYTSDEIKAIEAGAKPIGLNSEEALRCLGKTTLDLYLNGKAYWRNVPMRVWDYTLGGYQVLKKWLSYRERGMLDRDLTLEEAREVTSIVRRIAAILLMESALNGNYERVKKNTVPLK